MGRRLEGIPGFGIDRVAAAAGADPDVLRLENLDTDVPPHPDAVEATRAAVGSDEANSYLPFTGVDQMKEAVARLIARRGGPRYDPYGEVVITQGDGDNLLDALLAITDPGDEVILTDPTYAGMLQRVRLVGAQPRLVPLRSDASGWRLDLDALHAALSARTSALFVMNPSMPSGWVANEAHGTVHCVAEGDRPALEGLAGELRQGPRAAWVDRVELSWGPASGEFSRFEVRSGWHSGD